MINLNFDNFRFQYYEQFRIHIRIGEKYECSPLMIHILTRWLTESDGALERHVELLKGSFLGWVSEWVVWFWGSNESFWLTSVRPCPCPPPPFFLPSRAYVMRHSPVFPWSEKTEVLSPTQIPPHSLKHTPPPSSLPRACREKGWGGSTAGVGFPWPTFSHYCTHYKQTQSTHTHPPPTPHYDYY
jgi:hypothetical protein